MAPAIIVCVRLMPAFSTSREAFSSSKVSQSVQRGSHVVYGRVTDEPSARLVAASASRLYEMRLLRNAVVNSSKHLPTQYLAMVVDKQAFDCSAPFKAFRSILTEKVERPQTSYRALISCRPGDWPRRYTPPQVVQQSPFQFLHLHDFTWHVKDHFDLQSLPTLIGWLRNNDLIDMANEG